MYFFLKIVLDPCYHCQKSNQYFLNWTFHRPTSYEVRTLLLNDVFMSYETQTLILNCVSVSDTDTYGWIVQFKKYLLDF